MTKEEKQTYLDKHNDAICCSQICSACKDWYCDYRSSKHILECRRFKPKEEECTGQE